MNATVEKSSGNQLTNSSKAISWNQSHKRGMSIMPPPLQLKTDDMIAKNTQSLSSSTEVSSAPVIQCFGYNSYGHLGNLFNMTSRYTQPYNYGYGNQFGGTYNHYNSYNPYAFNRYGGYNNYSPYNSYRSYSPLANVGPWAVSAAQSAYRMGNNSKYFDPNYLWYANNGYQNRGYWGNKTKVMNNRLSAFNASEKIWDNAMKSIDGPFSPF